MFEHCFTTLKENHIILTVNQRLSLSLTREHAAWKKQQGHITWTSLSAQPFTSWITQLWQHHNTDHRVLLNSWQERQLWHTCVEQDERFALIQTQATAQQAQQAWQILNDWRLTTDDIAEHANHEVETFIEWAHDIEAQCQQHGWARSVDLIPELITLIEQQQITLPQHITLMGFDDFSPRLQQLIDTLSQCTEVHYDDTPNFANSQHRISLSDRRNEITTMARWAKQHWLNNPNQRIACIVPNLTELRDTIEQIFIDTFHLGALIDETTPLPFNCSAGRPLILFSLIDSALQGLRLCTNHHAPLSRWVNWLQSPYHHHHQQDAACADAAALALQQLGMEMLHKTTVAGILTQLHAAFPQSTWLSRWQALQPELPQHQLPSEWAQWMISCCHQWGWPGGRTITSLEHQLIQRFQGALQELASLDMVHQKLSLPQAINHLQTLLHQTPFQTEGSNAPIQILGVLEASGYQFDHLWMMNVNDETWPAVAQANPFLPATLQKQHRMPHADGERERHFAEQVQQRLCNSSPEVIISHHQTDQERHFQASPLTRHLPIITLDQLHLADTAISQVNQPITLSTLSDAPAPPLQSDEQPRGGTWILKQQAQCPFKAFAKARLQAHTPGESHVGLSPAQAGTLMHATLEAVWQHIKDHDTLVTLDNDTLTTHIEKAFNAAVNNTNIAQRVTPYFLPIEKKRVCSLLLEWLNLEKERSPFKVLAQEQTHQVNFGSLSFSISIDRIDQLANGEHLIIDYKTFQTSLTPWFQPRLDDPQLPTYYLTLQETLSIAGVGYAQIKASQLQFKGILHDRYENDTDTLLGFTPITQIRQYAMSWTAWHDHCHIAVEQLANEFCQGDARVDPMHPSACLTCDLQPLCRVFES